MSVLVDGQVAGRGRRAVGGAELPLRPVRRMAPDALRRPPRGVRVAERPRRGVAAACVVARPRPRWGMAAAVAVAVFAVIVGFGAAVGGMVGGMASSDVPDRTAVVAVAPGESLWDVASKYAPGSDPRAVVQRIEELNGVTADGVSAGSALTVPVEASGPAGAVGR